jgi:hypothetical protein
MKKIFISFSILFLLSSCATQRFNVDNDNIRQNPKSNPHYQESSHFFIGGIGQTDYIDAAMLCKRYGGVNFVEVKHSFVDGLLAVVTYGIYTPRTKNIYCKKD